MIKDIIFDLGGVLLDLNMQDLQKACQSLGISPELFFVKADEENTSTVCHGISASKVITAYQVGEMTSEAFLSPNISSFIDMICLNKASNTSTTILFPAILINFSLEYNLCALVI